MEFWIIILVAFVATNSLDKAESVQLEELPLQTFDELFVDEWLDKNDAEDLKTPAPTNFGQNVHHQIDRQNTQLGQIEPNSTDQNSPHHIESDHSGQIEPNSTDHNPPLTDSDHSDNAKNGEKQNEIMISNENIVEDERKRKIIDKFHTMKYEFKQKEKFPWKEGTKIEEKIAKHLKVNRAKIYKWKKELGINQKMIYEKEEHKHLVEKFDQIKAELKLAGFKNSYHHEIDETVAKEFGLSFKTIFAWKRELGQTKPNKYPHSEQKELMKQYYEIKDQNPKISDGDIAKMLKIGRVTVFKWKKQFTRQQLHPNAVDGHSVDENAAANVQEIDNSNSGSI